jgi:hypothetical protein
MQRSLTFEQARATYPHRFTCEHVPRWALRQRDDGTFYAPQYRTDSEWYERTTFPGERHLSKRSPYCESSGQSWPLGQSLPAPFTH